MLQITPTIDQITIMSLKKTIAEILAEKGMHHGVS